jgi:short-subunit dehydrogenase
MRLAGAVALVTGASSGVGRAVAVRLAGAGARVVAHGRDADRLAGLAAEIGCVTLTGDLAEPGVPDEVAAAAVAAAGRVDVLVNNAGAGWAGRFGAMPAGDVDRLVAVNLRAPIQLTRALLPGMVAGGAGHVAFVSSIAGRTGVAGEAVYAATKAGLDAFAESLRWELGGTGVTVSVLVPGVIDTAFFERRGQPYDRRRPRPVPAAKVAEALVRDIESERPERYLPRWLRTAVVVRAALPGPYRRLAGRFGQKV